MEQPCYRCDAPVEEGIAFCPNCGAPQIRVGGLREEPAPVPAPTLPEAPTGMTPPPPFGEPPRAARVEWSHALPGAAIAGLVVALAWILPFSAICLWVLVGGALSVALYQRRRPQAALTSGSGARLGAVTGLLGFAAFAVALAVQTVLFRQGARLRDALRQAMEESVAHSPDPRSHEALEMLLSPEGMALIITLVMVGFLAAFVLFGALGGVLGVSLLRRPPSR